MLANKLMSALSGGVEDKRYVDDVFSAYTYTGNSATQTISNGIDLAGKGGLVWIKGRSTAYTHSLYDTARGAPNRLSSETTGAQISDTSSLTSFSSNGFALKTISNVNQTSQTFVSWTFRRAPKFFDVVTWTGNGANRTIPHALGQEVGMMLVKRTNSAADWQVYHRSLTNTGYMVLNSTAVKATGATRWNSTTATTSNISLGADATVNASGGAYVAYLFAHDPSADGIIQCGSFTTDAGGNATVNLGWEPQYLMVKTSSAVGDWWLQDTSRGMPNGTSGKLLWANYSNAEADSNFSKPNATGFTGTYNSDGTYIYLAIRRPNKPPTTGTQVYNAIARTGTGGAATVTGVGFAPDLAVIRQRASTTLHFNLVDRLRGATKVLFSSSSDAEGTYAQTVTGFDVMDGVRLGTDEPNTSGSALINHFFKRAPGFFDIVCYTGEGGVHTFPHSLGVAPELLIVKKRNAPDGSDEWQVYAAPLSAAGFLWLNSTMAYSAAGSMWNNTAPNSTLFTVGTYDGVNQYTTAYVAYLFASLLGVSKVGSYTGNGTTQTINCEFTTGARFFLVKTTSTAGSWWVFDSARGIVSAFDPALQLNSTAAEISSADAVDPDPMGIIVNQEATCSLNAAGVSYVYLAIS